MNDMNTNTTAKHGAVPPERRQLHGGFTSGARRIKQIAAFALVVVFYSCGSTSLFPVSRIAPAAEISAKKSRDTHMNYVIEVTVRDLAKAERLEPPGNNYSVWIVTNEHGVMNVGQLNIKSLKRFTYTTTTPFDFYEIFITVEYKGDLIHPAGTEIVRTRI